MIDREEWSIIRLLITLRTMSLSASVYRRTMSKSGSLNGLHRHKRILIFWSPGSQETKSTTSSQDHPRTQHTTGPTMLQELSSEYCLDLPSSGSFQSKTSMLDAGLHTPTWCSSYLKELVVVSDISVQLWCTITGSTRELWWTTQISGGGTCAEFCQETHQFQMPTESGELDRLQSSISTTRCAIDTEWEDLDTCHGTVPWTNQLCHSSTIRDPMSSTVPSRETVTLPHNSSEQALALKAID